MTNRLSRRTVVARALAAAGAATVAPVLERAGLVEQAAAAEPDFVVETLNGFVAFVVPGRDPYSVAQGESTPEPGGVEAGGGYALAAGLNMAQAGQLELAASIATLLNGLALAVAPAPPGTPPFSSPFANLMFAQKAAVLEALERDPLFAGLRSLVGVLPALAAFVSYSEAAVFDRGTRTLVGTPIGWSLTSYNGVADGRDAFIGYFEDRRNVDA